MKKLAVLFDMDGVLVDNHAYHVKSWKEFGNKHQAKVSSEDFNTHMAGRSTKAAVKWVFGDNLPEEKISKLFAEKESIYRQIYSQHISEVSGLSRLLLNLQKVGIPLAVATSAPKENLEFTMEALKVDHYFAAKVTSDEVANAKPHPDIYLEAAARLNILPQNCVVFEDSRAGIQAAKAAGCAVVALTTSHNSQYLYPANPHFIIKDFTEMSSSLIRQISDRCV